MFNVDVDVDVDAPVGASTIPDSVATVRAEIKSTIVSQFFEASGIAGYVNTLYVLQCYDYANDNLSYVILNLAAPSTPIGAVEIELPVMGGQHTFDCGLETSLSTTPGAWPVVWIGLPATAHDEFMADIELINSLLWTVGFFQGSATDHTITAAQPAIGNISEISWASWYIASHCPDVAAYLDAFHVLGQSNRCATVPPDSTSYLDLIAGWLSPLGTLAIAIKLYWLAQAIRAATDTRPTATSTRAAFIRATADPTESRDFRRADAALARMIKNGWSAFATPKQVSANQTDAESFLNSVLHIIATSPPSLGNALFRSYPINPLDDLRQATRQLYQHSRAITRLMDQEREYRRKDRENVESTPDLRVLYNPTLVLMDRSGTGSSRRGRRDKGEEVGADGACGAVGMWGAGLLGLGGLLLGALGLAEASATKRELRLLRQQQHQQQMHDHCPGTGLRFGHMYWGSATQLLLRELGRYYSDHRTVLLARVTETDSELARSMDKELHDIATCGPERHAAVAAAIAKETALSDQQGVVTTTNTHLNTRYGVLTRWLLWSAFCVRIINQPEHYDQNFVRIIRDIQDIIVTDCRTITHPEDCIVILVDIYRYHRSIASRLGIPLPSIAASIAWDLVSELAPDDDAVCVE